MLLSEEIQQKYDYTNLLSRNLGQYILIENFDNPPNSRVLCVGCNNDVTPNILADCGHYVTGVDLIKWKPDQVPNYCYIPEDFCQVPLKGGYDAVVALDTISYFGTGNYGEVPLHMFYDVIAMRRIWDLLVVGGVAYITFPVGANFVENYPHWRIYNPATLSSRIVQDFQVLGYKFFTVLPARINRVEYAVSCILEAPLAFQYVDPYVPAVLCFMKLLKTDVVRSAHPIQLDYKLPEGRERYYNYDQPYIYAEWNPQPGDVCVDVGTGSGTWPLAALNRGVEVIVFEPKASNVKNFTDAAELNKFTNYTLVHKGLSDTVGRISFSEEHGRCQEDSNTVSVTTLDHYFAENQLTRLDYINMDVEGHELHVLRGARQTLSQYKPKVIVEVHLMMDITFEQVEEELRQCGYKTFRRMNDLLVATRD